MDLASTIATIRSELHKLLLQTKKDANVFDKNEFAEIVKNLTIALDNLPRVTGNAREGWSCSTSCRRMIASTIKLIKVKHSGRNTAEEEAEFKKVLALFKISFSELTTFASQYRQEVPFLATSSRTVTSPHLPSSSELSRNRTQLANSPNPSRRPTSTGTLLASALSAGSAPPRTRGVEREDRVRSYTGLPTRVPDVSPEKKDVNSQNRSTAGTVPLLDNDKRIRAQSELFLPVSPRSWEKIPADGKVGEDGNDLNRSRSPNKSSEDLTGSRCKDDPFQWEYMKSNGSWNVYDDISQQEIEKGWRQGLSQVILAHGWAADDTYTVMFKGVLTVIQKNNVTGRWRYVRRIAGGDRSPFSIAKNRSTLPPKGLPFLDYGLEHIEQGGLITGESIPKPVWDASQLTDLLDTIKPDDMEQSWIGTPITNVSPLKLSSKEIKVEENSIPKQETPEKKPFVRAFPRSMSDMNAELKTNTDKRQSDVDEKQLDELIKSITPSPSDTPHRTLRSVMTSPGAFSHNSSPVSPSRSPRKHDNHRNSHDLSHVNPSKKKMIDVVVTDITDKKNESSKQLDTKVISSSFSDEKISNNSENMKENSAGNLTEKLIPLQESLSTPNDDTPTKLDAALEQVLKTTPELHSTRKSNSVSANNKTNIQIVADLARLESQVDNEIKMLMARLENKDQLNAEMELKKRLAMIEEQLGQFYDFEDK